MTENWSYYSSNTIQIIGDLSSKYFQNSLIYIVQGGTAKFFLITAVNIVSGNTRITVSGGGTYTLTSDTITEHYYNAEGAAPLLPLNFRTQASLMAASAKTSLDDSDKIQIADSADSFITKSVTWENVKASSKTYFDTLYHNLRYAAQYSMGTGQSIAPGTYVDLVFPTEVFDTDDAVITDGSFPYPPWRFVAPVDGAYRISGMVLFQSYDWTAGGHIQIKLYKNGTAVLFIGIVDIFASVTMTITVPFDGIVQLSAGDYIHIGLSHPSASTLSLANAGTVNRITITRI